MEPISKPLLGYRAWKIIDNRLYPFTFTEEDTEDFGSKEVVEWKSGINHSFCVTEARRGNPDLSPHSHKEGFVGCHCGYNAFFKPKELREYLRDDDKNYIIGAIAGAGRIEIHRTGFRSEQAQILGLLDCSLDSDLLEDLSEHYSVPVFSEDWELTNYVQPLASGINEFKTDKASAEYREDWRNLVWPRDSIDDEPSIDEGREKRWYKNELLHREHGPALVSSSQKRWCRNGSLYREDDQPNFILKTDNYVCLMWNNENEDLHREGGLPAIVQYSKSKNPNAEANKQLEEWWNRENPRIEELPDYVYENAIKLWFLNGAFDDAGREQRIYDRVN